MSSNREEVLKLRNAFEKRSDLFTYIQHSHFKEGGVFECFVNPGTSFFVSSVYRDPSTRLIKSANLTEAVNQVDFNKSFIVAIYFDNTCYFGEPMVGTWIFPLTTVNKAVDNDSCVWKSSAYGGVVHGIDIKL